jgi:hypothetical protein
MGHFTQADSVIPGAGNSAAWDRYAYTLSNPLRYTDPSGHKCVSEGPGDCLNNDNETPINGAGGAGSGGGSGGGGPITFTPLPGWQPNIISSNGYPIIPGLPSGQDICSFMLSGSGSEYMCGADYSGLFDQSNPFSIPSLMGTIPYIRYDLSRVDPNSLAWDTVGLGLSITGIKSVQNGLAIASGIKPVNATIRLIDSAVKGTTFTHTSYSLYYIVSDEKVDTVALATTIVSIYPPAAVGASSISILRDLSAGFYDMRDSRNLLPGLPAGPYCDGVYGC